MPGVESSSPPVTLRITMRTGTEGWIVGYLSIPNMKQTLSILAEKLNASDIRWALTGSMNLALQGLSVHPKRIGIVTMHENRDTLSELFRGYPIIELFRLENDEAEEIRYRVNSIELLICLEFEHGFYRQFLDPNHSLVQIKINTHDIPCLRLEDELRAYEHIGKPEKAEMIRTFLASE